MIDLSPFTGGPRERLVAALVAACGEFVPREALERAAGVKSIRLGRLLAEIGESGVSIETMPGRGHRLAASAPLLDRAAVEREAARAPRLGRALLLPAVTSTNDVALALGEAGERGAVVVAEAQTRGRGRKGRSWVSPPGAGLWVSLLVGRGEGLRGPHLLTPAAALAACRAAREVAEASLLVKWPNDLVAWPRGEQALAPPGGAAADAPRPWLKVGGILSEGRGSTGGTAFVVIGVGLNVAPVPEAVAASLAAPVASLADLAGRPVARERLLGAFLSALDPLLDVVEREGLAPLLPELRALSPLLGRRVTVRAEGRVISGVARDIDPDGALLVEAAPAAGRPPRLERVLAGEATLAETD